MIDINERKLKEPTPPMSEFELYRKWRILDIKSKLLRGELKEYNKKSKNDSWTLRMEWERHCGGRDLKLPVKRNYKILETDKMKIKINLGFPTVFPNETHGGPPMISDVGRMIKRLAREDKERYKKELREYYKEEKKTENSLICSFVESPEEEKETSFIYNIFNAFTGLFSRN